MRITPHFTREELQCHCPCAEMRFTEAGVWYLEALRVAFGRPLPVSSAYRCPGHNVETSHDMSDDGPHTVFEGDNVTADLKVFGDGCYRLVPLAIALGFTGIGVSQKGPHGYRFVHLDRPAPGRVGRPRPWMWSYGIAALVTCYVPTVWKFAALLTSGG